MNVDMVLLQKVYAALDRARKAHRTITYGGLARAAGRHGAQWPYKHLWLIGLYWEIAALWKKHVKK